MKSPKELFQSEIREDETIIERMYRKHKDFDVCIEHFIDGSVEGYTVLFLQDQVFHMDNFVIEDLTRELLAASPEGECMVFIRDEYVVHCNYFEPDESLIEGIDY